MWRRAAPGEPRGKDCVFEADLLTWRDAFRDVGAAITLMERHGVRYRHKFSGHRSLHMVILNEDTGLVCLPIARGALAVARDPRAVPHLIPRLGDSDSKTRSEASKALIAIGEPAVAALQRDLADESLESRKRRNRVKHILDKLGVEV